MEIKEADVKGLVDRDAVTKRYRASCPLCGRPIERSGRASVEHNMKLHLIYQHDLQL